MHHPTDRIAHNTAFVTPVVEHWLEREIAQWVHPMKDRSNGPSHHERTLLPRSYISLLPSTKSTAHGNVCFPRMTNNTQTLVQNLQLHVPIPGHSNTPICKHAFVVEEKKMKGKKELISAWSCHFLFPCIHWFNLLSRVGNFLVTNHMPNFSIRLKTNLFVYILFIILILFIDLF